MFVSIIKTILNSLFFIHGENDDYVPSYMALENYKATRAAKFRLEF